MTRSLDCQNFHSLHSTLSLVTRALFRHTLLRYSSYWLKAPAYFLLRNFHTVCHNPFRRTGPSHWLRLITLHCTVRRISSKHPIDFLVAPLILSSFDPSTHLLLRYNWPCPWPLWHQWQHMCNSMYKLIPPYLLLLLLHHCLPSILILPVIYLISNFSLYKCFILHLFPEMSFVPRLLL